MSPAMHRSKSLMEVSPTYFVVMIDYGRRGREAVVDPEQTRREVVARIKSGEYKKILFIHRVDKYGREDLTEELQAEALPLSYPLDEEPAGRQAARFDHARDHRKYDGLT